MSTQVNGSILTGGVDTEALDRTARTGVVMPADDDPVAWDPSWVQSFSRWDVGGGWSGAVILVFAEHPSVIGDALDAKKIFDIANEMRPEPGIYLLGRAVTSNAWCVPNTGVNFQVDCSYLASVALDKLPTVVLGREPGKLRFYASGTQGDGLGAIDYEIQNSEPSLTEYKLLDALKTFAKKQLNSQEMRRELWQEAAKWIPIELAETTIQSYLLVALRVLFKNCATLAETNLDIGRTDLFMLGPQEEAARALLELKVLRSYTSGAKPVADAALKRHLMGGRTQARTYGDKLGAAIKLLCSYDMRKEKTISFLDEIKKECGTTGVGFQNYPICNNSASVRNGLMA